MKDTPNTTAEIPNTAPAEQGRRTRANLEAAFAGESMANRKYLYFAKLARLKGAPDVAALFEATADEETAHAHAHLSQLYPPESLTVEDLLRLAMEGELYETNQMYPEFERVAHEEKEHAAARELAAQRRESAEHAELFREALDLAERRFRGLAKVEARHAKRYGDALAARADATRAAE